MLTTWSRIKVLLKHIVCKKNLQGKIVGPIGYLEALVVCLYNNELCRGGFFTPAALATQTDAQDLVFSGSDKATSPPIEVCVWPERWLSQGPKSNHQNSC